jgi:hypothetical protein
MARPLIFQNRLPELAPGKGLAAWLPGLRRAGPSTPLDKSAAVSVVGRDYRMFRRSCQVLIV